MLSHTSTRGTPAWRFICAVAAAVALLPAGAMAASPQKDRIIASGAHDLTSPGLLAELNADVYGGFTSPGRDLLMRGKKGKKGKGKKGKGKKGKGKKGKGKKGKGEGRGKGKGKGRGEGRDTEGEVQCTLTAAVEEVEVYDAEFLHASAIAELFEMVCSEPEWVSLEEVVEVFVQRDAVAFAQATAAAMVDCKSTDEDAYLCASVTASANAFAQTVVTAHVEATAAAIRGCGCQDSITAFGTSETFINLVAEATATATATACIQGTGRVVDSAYSSCTSFVFARVFARAAARAIIEGDCLNGQAVAELLLEADALDVTAGSTCDGIAEVDIVPGEVGRGYTTPYGEYYYDY